MTKFIIVFLLTAICGSSCFVLSSQGGSDLPSPEIGAIDLIGLDEKLTGRWTYQVSFHGKAEAVFDDLGDLSEFYTFEATDTDLIANDYPRFYEFAKDKMLFGLESHHDSQHRETISFPLVIGYHQDSTLLEIGHFERGDGIGMTYHYFIATLSRDTLILVNERVYEIGEQSVSGVSHVYTRE